MKGHVTVSLGATERADFRVPEPRLGTCFLNPSVKSIQGQLSLGGGEGQQPGQLAKSQAKPMAGRPDHSPSLLPCCVAFKASRFQGQ